PDAPLRTPPKQAGCCQPLATPPKPGAALPAEPWTPTANLKVLIRAASPEIRSRELSRCQEHSAGDERGRPQKTRREKSLGSLCHKFLARYPDYPSAEENYYICLDEVAEELKFERRRIYDIVHVLESLHMVSRLAQNKYIWHGKHHLAKTLQTLKKAGEENKYMLLIETIKKREYKFDLDGKRSEEVLRSFSTSEQAEMCSVELPGMEFRAASVNSKKDKSLRLMSQKFVMLFLVSTPQIISLEVAAEILIVDQLEDFDKSKFKTKIRRVYDIANVLSSLQLIKKVYITEERGRKPAFKWTGPEVTPNTQATKLETTPAPCISHISESTTTVQQCAKNLFPSRGKQNFTRHPSLMKLLGSTESNRRKIQSAPTSPVKISTAGTDENVSVDTSETAQLAAVPQHQLEGPKTPKEVTKNLLGSTLEHSVPQPEAAPRANTHNAAPPPKSLITQPLSALPPSHCSALPVTLPQPHSGASDAVYLPPFQAHAVTTYGPSFMPLPCANVTGIKSTNPKALHEMTTREGDNCTAAADPGKAMAAQERCESSSKRCLKRSQALQENNLMIKMHRSNEESLDSAMTFFPSGYLIPLTQCTQHSNKACLLNRENTGICSLQHPGTYSSPTAGVIPMTASELTAVNIPAFQITSLNITLTPTSIATAPVLSNSCLNSGNVSSVPNPGSSLLDFALQHGRLIAAGVQVPPNPVLQHIPTPLQPESINHSSQNVTLQEKVRNSGLQL
ncbi:E2F8 factor, partial [Odontophorus gujanensis]|nr:E2F8 factor [Odontophorus gujanensis]